MKGTCSMCRKVIRSRRSDNGTAKQNFLKALRKHVWKQHRTSMIARIKAGKGSSDDNPSVQDLISGLQSSPREAIRVYKRMTNAQYKHMKRVMDAIEPILPIEVRVAWKALEAIHDEL